MRIKSILHRKIEKIFYPDNFEDIEISISTTLENNLDCENDEETTSLFIEWTMSIYVNGLSKASMEFLGQSIATVDCLTDYDEDLPQAELIVLKSCNDFFRQVSEIMELTPLINPDFNEIACKVLEALTNEGKY